jgi:predicted small secreted protein
MKPKATYHKATLLTLVLALAAFALSGCGNAGGGG